MAEIILGAVVIFIIFSQQIIAGLMAKSMGRSFWFWFGIAFLLPVIAVIILAMKEDKNPGGNHELADHVKKRNEAR
ncbi:hypothetical protein [Hufsiella ginkgonis]|uniref:Uncharacterized protein n=1 Tax=Hufsiella ginkgonis TaxID=2695274 RepID=A0A7K1XUQ0_9SPHI|nr:hypothetical protein [Hufsiella ginkgonis]MXV14216.1 hypothetical protein [Hufsiella ginkgonis]